MLPLARLQVLSGAFAGRELELTKALTTLGRPGVQVAAITRRAEGYYIVHVESGKDGDYPLVNGQPIGAQARKLADNDVVNTVMTAIQRIHAQRLIIGGANYTPQRPARIR